MDMKRWISGFFVGIGLAIALLGTAVAQFGNYDRGPTWQTYLEGESCGFHKEQTLIITNQGEWQKYWVTLCGGTTPASSAYNDIDWSKEMLIAINLGDAKSWGYKVYVQTVRKIDSSSFSVDYVAMTPDPRQKWVEGSYSPYVIVRCEKVAGNLKFSKTNRVNYNNFGARQGRCSKTCECRCSSCCCGR